MTITRRGFLQVGLAGTAFLALAGTLRGQPRALDSDATIVLAAIVPAMLAGVRPFDASLTDAVVAGVGRAVDGLPPHLQKEVRQLFALLAFAPTRRWVAGVTSPWPQASREEVSAFLERWRFSRWALLQQGYLALHELVFAAWYARPDAWPAIGYPGPPKVD